MRRHGSHSTRQTSITDNRGGRAAALEMLEARELLSGAPAVNVADPSVVNAAYVQAVYKDALGRDADPASQAWWVAVLDAGQPRSLLTDAIVNSDEHLSQFITSAYEQYLGRRPEQSAIQYWLDKLHTGCRDEFVEAALLASDEFEANAGDTQLGWIDAAYEAVLRRPADATAVAWATTQLDAGMSLSNLAILLTTSEEHEEQSVQAELSHLQLPPDVAETQFFAPALAAGQITDEQLTVDFMTSGQYFKVQTSVPVTLVPVPSVLPGAQQRFEQIASQAALGDENVVFVGDSITQLWQGKVGLPAWNQDFAPLPSVDAGIAGDTIENVLWRLEVGNLNGVSPKLAVVMIGLNDLSQGASSSDVAAGITAVVQTLRTEFPAIKILLLGLLPGLQVAPDSIYRQEIAQVNQILEPLADGQHVWFLDLTPYFINPDGSTNQSLYQADHTHPNASGYQVMAQAIAPWVRDLSS